MMPIKNFGQEKNGISQMHTFTLEDLFFKVSNILR